MKITDWKYTIQVHEEHAMIYGNLTFDVLQLLIRLCRKEKFTHMLRCEGGFKLVRENEMGQ